MGTRPTPASPASTTPQGTSRPRVRFGLAWMYTGAVLAALTCAPLALPYRDAEVGTATPLEWVVATMGSLAVAGGLLVVRRRCSSERLSYWDGLVVVSASMFTGWAVFSLIFVVPALLATVLASVAFALTAPPEEAATRFHRLVSRIWEARLRR